MGLPQGTVKARLARARDLLRRRFPDLEKQHTGAASAKITNKKEA